MDIVFENKAAAVTFSNRRRILFLTFAVVALIAVALVAISKGNYNVPLAEVWSTMVSKLGIGVQEDIVFNNVVWEIRAPRILVAAVVGMALASAGGVYQGTFRNPLVEPFILGVSSGAAFGAAFSILFPNFTFSVQISAFLFGVVAVFMAYFLARVRGQTPLVTLILAGVIISSLFSSGVSIMKYISDDPALREIIFWLMGGFYYSGWSEVHYLVPLVLICTIFLSLMGWKLNIISMGDEEAKTLGVNPERTKIMLIIVATFITALSVSTVGVIGWVGLMMPHAARLVIGPDHRFLIPSAAVMGAVFLVICDTLARTLTTAEIPVGIITSILGAPYLIYLLRTKRNAFFG